MIDYAQLAAMAAVLRTGSFEKAARQMNLTPSAISQRVKALEERVGAALIRRGPPCTATPAGMRLYRHAEDIGLMEQKLAADLGLQASDGEWPTVRLAVNADSLATWFVAAMAGAENILFDLVVDDQDYSADWLRRGEVSAAVTAHDAPIPGCQRLALGSLRYIATASPAFMKRWFENGVTPESLARAPCFCFNRKDGLQTRWQEAVFGRAAASPTHWMPSSQAFADAARAGLGWGMNMEIMVRGHLADGDLVPLLPDRPLDVPLCWQWPRSAGPALAPVTKSVLAAARKDLISPPEPASDGEKSHGPRRNGCV